MNRFVIITCLLFSISAHTQPYKDAIGLRFANLGFTQLNVKHFLNEYNALELSAGGNTNYVWLQGNFEWQQELIPEVDYYFGLGSAIGSFSGEPLLQNSVNDRFVFGATGVVGAEYTLTDFPFTFSIDTGPFLQVIPSLNLGWTVGIAARYVLR